METRISTILLRGRRMLDPTISPAEGGVQVDGKMGTDDSPTSQILDFRRCISFIGATYFFVMTIYFVPVACFASCILFLFPIMFINMKLFNKLEHRFCRFVNDHWVTVAYYSGADVREYGADLSKYVESKCLFLANHLGLMDHFAIMTSLHNQGNVPGSWMWVIYNIWKFTPLGVMWTLHGNFFVNGGQNKREALLEGFKRHLRKYFTRHNYSWIIMYPEGSRFYLIRESGSNFAKKNGLKPLQHCAYPRTGAAHAVLDVLGPQLGNKDVARKGDGEPIKYIIDATLGYPKGQVVDIGSAIMGDFPLNDPSVAIHYEVIPVKPEWADEAKLQEFLYERYRRKNELLEEFYKKGRFPGESRGTVQVNGWTMLMAQVFWIGTYYLHHILWIRPLWTSLCTALYSLIF